MGEYLSNGRLVLDARNDLHRSAAVLAHRNVDQKNSFQALRPRQYLRPDDPPLLLLSYTRPAAIRQKINALASRTHAQARDVFDLFVLGDGTLRGIDTGFLRRWLDDATLRNARGRALEISHAEYSDTVLAYLDPTQREQWQDGDTWIARQLFVCDLIDQILAVPSETIT